MTNSQILRRINFYLETEGMKQVSAKEYLLAVSPETHVENLIHKDMKVRVYKSEHFVSLLIEYLTLDFQTEFYMAQIK